MSTAPIHLLGRLNLAHVWEASRQELIRVLGQPEQKKVIVWDEALIGQVGLIAEVSFLRQHGVYKMVRLPTPSLTEQYPDANEYLFFVSPTIRFVDMVIDAISTSSKKHGKRFKVVFVPQKSQHCITRFIEFGFDPDVKGPIQFSVEEFHLEMLPLDSDVISLDLNSAFSDLFIEQDPTPLFYTAKAICKLQALYGIIPKIYGKGTNAKLVADLLERMGKEVFSNSSSAREVTPQFDAIILLDRSIDLMTPLSTQLTYEGLIDEIFSIKYCTSKFPRQMFSEELQSNPKGGPPLKGPIGFMLTSEENMFAEMRDLNFRAVGKFLSREAKKITAAYEERHGAKTVSQLKQFVQKLPHMQQAKLALSKHTTIAELIKTVTDRKSFLEQIHTEQQLREEDLADKAPEYIQNCIGRSEPLAKVLKLICMQSVANNGLRPRQLDTYRKEILQGYGYESLVGLHRLEKAGLLQLQDTRTFSNLRKTLRLVTERVDELNPKDISYTFSGYAPLSVRLVEILEKPNGWEMFQELTRPLPGPGFVRLQRVARGQERKKRPTADRPQLVLVFFIGGCTYAEISALRFLAQREDATTEYVIGTTHITNGISLVNSVLADTPRFHPVKLWDNQLDDQPGPTRPPPVGGASKLRSQ